jgi:hypothetical protein
LSCPAPVVLLASNQIRTISNEFRPEDESHGAGDESHRAEDESHRVPVREPPAAGESGRYREMDLEEVLRLFPREHHGHGTTAGRDLAA